MSAKTCGAPTQEQPTMKTLYRLALAVCAAAMIGAAPAHAATTLRFGHANSPGEIAHDLFAELADRVSKRTGSDHSRTGVRAAVPGARRQAQHRDGEQDLVLGLARFHFFDEGSREAR